MTRQPSILLDMTPLQAGAPTLYNEPQRLLRALLSSWPTDSDAPALHALANGHLPLIPDLLPPGHPNLRLSYGDYPLHAPSEGNARAYAAWWRNTLERYRPAVVHLWDPFHSAMPDLPEPGDTPLVLSLSERPLAGLSREARALLRRADALCVTTNAQRDALLALGLATERVRLLPLPPGPLATLGYDHALAARSRARRGLRGDYLLTLTEAEHLPALLTAYAALRSDVRERLTLALACPLSSPEAYRLEGLAEELGIYERLVWIEQADDMELATLVRASSACVGLLSEGAWGVQLSDLLACGAHVLARRMQGQEPTDSVIQAHPDDPASLAAGLEELAERALRHSDGAPATVPPTPAAASSMSAALYTVYQSLPRPVRAARRRHATPCIERLALVSPLPPQRSGIADFSACLMAALRQRVDVTAYVAPAERDIIFRRTVEGPVETITALPEAVVAGRVDAILYQVGNSDYHHFQLPYLLALPGVVNPRRRAARPVLDPDPGPRRCRRLCA